MLLETLWVTWMLGGFGFVRSCAWFALAVLVVGALFVLGAQPFAVGIVPVPYDKLAHALAFGALFLVMERALAVPLGMAVAISLLISGADEIHQLWLPGRQAGFDDWFADCGGIMIALLIRRRMATGRWITDSGG